MNEEEEESVRRNFLDITQYSEKTRTVIFAILVIVLLGIVAVSMFVISPRNDAQIAEMQSSPSATQAAVDSDKGDITGGEAVTPSKGVPSGNYEELPVDEMDEARKAQEKIIQDSLQREKEQTDEIVEDDHPILNDTAHLSDKASQGVLEYCLNYPDETKEQKQERMKPFFHTDNSDYRSPESIFYLTRCSVEGVSAPILENNEVIVHVGVAWGGQFEEGGTAETGYSQYRVVVDKDGIVSFDD